MENSPVHIWYLQWPELNFKVRPELKFSQYFIQIDGDQMWENFESWMNEKLIKALLKVNQSVQQKFEKKK